MARRTYQSTDLTSFHGDVIRTSVDQLRKTFGYPDMENNTGEDKVNFEWGLETNEGEVFTIYDWKEGRPLKSDEIVTWHIGARNKTISNVAERELRKAL